MSLSRLPRFILLFVLLAALSTAHAFTFNFNYEDYPNDGPPQYRAWFSPSQVNSYDRSSMVDGRQRMMNYRDNTMGRLGNILYSKTLFDRAEAIMLTRQIELSAGSALSNSFHPGVVASFHSRTTPAFWGNEARFKANAQKLQAAAQELAFELEKKPSAEEGAVYLSNADSEDKTVGIAVSPKIWEKYNTMSSICEHCHNNFRGPSW